MINAFTSSVGQQIGRELASANVASLKAKADVKINQANFEKDLDHSGPAGAPATPTR